LSVLLRLADSDYLPLVSSNYSCAIQFFSCPAHDSNVTYSFFGWYVRFIVRPSALCYRHSSAVLELIAFIFGMMIGHDV